MHKRMISLLLAALLLAGCAASPAQEAGLSQSAPETDSAEAAVPETQVVLGWSPQDGLNPFTCETQQNYYIAGLLFEPLVALSPAYEIEYRLAQEVVLDGVVCAVTLREGLRFSDGSAVTSADIVYSMNAARAVSRYAAQLSNVASVAASGENGVVITLYAPDVFFGRSLTFPIVKADTAADTLPVGAGRYIRAAGDTLGVNPYYWGEPGRIETVTLHSFSSAEEQSFAVMSGEIDMIYSDLRDTVDLGISTGHAMVTLNNLVFVGVNREGYQFSGELVELMSWLLPRSEVAARAYSGYATATESILNPAMAEVDATFPRVTQEDILARLAALGFSEPGEDGWRTRYGQRWALPLIVGDGNTQRIAAAQRIAEGFAVYGLRVTVETLPYADYLARIASGNYALYLGEMRLTDNMDVSALLSPGEGLSRGIVADATLLAAYAEMKRGNMTPSDFCLLFCERPTVLPVVFRRGIVCYSRTFSANIVATQQDIFYNIQCW